MRDGGGVGAAPPAPDSAEGSRGVLRGATYGPELALKRSLMRLVKLPAPILPRPLFNVSLLDILFIPDDMYPLAETMGDGLLGDCPDAVGECAAGDQAGGAGSATASDSSAL